MAAKRKQATKRLRPRTPPGPAPAMGKRKSMTFRIPEDTLNALTKEAKRRKIPRAVLVVEILMEQEKSFATAE